MANLTLNTTSSIVDFLKSQNKPSDFTSRENLYKTSGLEARLGKYVGSSSQNTAFLRQLQTPVVPTPPETSPFRNPNAEIFDTPANAAITGVPTPTTATDALSTLGYQQKTPDQIAQEALESPAFKLYQEKTGIQQLGLEGKAAEERQALQAKATALSKETEESFGKRGLFFSGMRPEAISAIAASLAASQLGVDRELATKLLEQDVDTRKEFLDQVAQVAKDAQAGNKQALDILEKQGLTVGLDGKLTPTLAARSGMSAEESLRLAEERLALSEAAGRRAEESALRAERKASRDTETRDIGGRLVRITFNESGEEVSRQDLGPAGAPTQNENEVLFAQYVAQLDPNTKTVAELNADALKFGLNPQDASVSGIINSANTTSTIRRFLGF